MLADSVKMSRWCQPNISRYLFLTIYLASCLIQQYVQQATKKASNCWPFFIVRYCCTHFSVWIYLTASTDLMISAFASAALAQP